MPIRIEIREDEDIESVLKRFRKLMGQTYNRPWLKHRYGFYEKPSVLRRKRKMMRRRNRYIRNRKDTPVHLWMDLERLLCRTAPFAKGQ